MSSTRSANKVIVIGGGIAGLTSAWHLTKAGFDVVVLDAGSTPGGRCRDVVLDGVPVRAGARMLYSFYGGVMDLIGELGIADQMVRLGHASIQCESGTARYPITFGPSKDLLFGGAISFRTLLRLRRLMPDLLAARRHGNPDDLTSLVAYDHLTLSEYLQAKGLGEFDANVVQPLFRGARNWNTQDVSPGFFLLTTAFMAGHYAFTFKNGIGYLAQKLAERLQIRHEVRVSSVQETENGVRVAAVDARDAALMFDADLVVCATEGDSALHLMQKPQRHVSEFFAGVRYNPLNINYAVLANRPDKTLDFYGQMHASGLAIMECVPGSGRPEDPPKIFCESGPEQSRARMAGLDNAVLLADLEQHIGDTLPDAAIERWVNQWIPSMLPVPYPGYITALKAFRREQASAPRRVYFAGDYLATALVGGACASGVEAAGLIQSHWAQAR
jgi:oxygen-dependent protoporphyrinogen oxidase